jgi:hypothetical protein
MNRIMSSTMKRITVRGLWGAACIISLAMQPLAAPNAKGETKMDPLDANRLAAEADDAIVCITQLLPPGTSCP